MSIKVCETMLFFIYDFIVSLHVTPAIYLYYMQKNGEFLSEMRSTSARIALKMPKCQANFR